MTEQEEFRILYNERDNITYFLHLKKDGQDFASIDREELAKALKLENCIIVIIVPNDMHDPNKGATFYALTATKWSQYSEIRNGKSIVAMKKLRNLKGFEQNIKRFIATS